MLLITHTLLCCLIQIQSLSSSEDADWEVLSELVTIVEDDDQVDMELDFEFVVWMVVGRTGV